MAAADPLYLYTILPEEDEDDLDVEKGVDEIIGVAEARVNEQYPFYIDGPIKIYPDGIKVTFRDDSDTVRDEIYVASDNLEPDSKDEFDSIVQALARLSFAAHAQVNDAGGPDLVIIHI